MLPILREVLDNIPKDKDISNSGFEGANIVLYTKDRKFFLDNEGVIRNIVDKIKKRVELRADPSIALDIEAAEEKIKEIIPKDAKASNVIFDPQRNRVIIEAEKPGLAIGKSGEVLKEIRRETLWVPTVRRTPALRSKIIENIRQVLYENNDYRKKFLNAIGERIYSGYTKEKKSEWVRVSFLGAARQVGRSCLFLQTPESRILLDCGVNIASPEQYAYPLLDAPEFKIQELDAIICCHAHLDHSGFIPWLFRMGYRGPVYCTAPTRDISALLALDYISIAFKEAKDAIFNVNDVKETVKHTVCLDYMEVTDITPDIRLTFYDAGHILGSAMAHLHIGNGMHNLLYSSDFKFGKTSLLEPATTKFPRLETLIMESTYGGKENIVSTFRESEMQLMEIVKKTIERGGKVLIPTLGVGRSQEMMVIIEKAMKEGRMPKVPIFLQGMVWDVTAIHTAYPDFLSAYLRRQIFHKDQNPFLSDIFKQVGSYKEQQNVIEKEGPCIIIATSGMLTGGPSVAYFKALADNKKNSIIFVNYQGEGSLGRLVQSGEKEVKVNGDEPVKINFERHTLDGFSGHSDRNQLINFVKRLEPQPKKIIIVHGENSRCLDLASSLHKMQRVETIAPKNLEAIRIR
ncbi:beta-CASP ribonuclease aCPSF1 [Candidatus Woesearchaeota archaeon]|nr:beta-CASP ribonuclease aCPSF1 [Candidatus Woesearchaeota archaeon]